MLGLVTWSRVVVGIGETVTNVCNMVRIVARYTRIVVIL
jgi:hypothetical protein